MKIAVFYHGSFGERFIANLVNYPNSCPSFGACGLEHCINCKNYSYSQDIVGVFEMEDPAGMPEFIDEMRDIHNILGSHNTSIQSDVVVAIHMHPDVLLALPDSISADALIVPIEDPEWYPKGILVELERKCERLGIEFSAPKPFCILRERNDTPTINEFIRHFRIGFPKFRIHNGVEVLRSEPCGAAWFVAIRLRWFDFENMRELWDRISEAHHSFPCTASMKKDSEYGDSLLHVAGYILRHAVDEAVGYEGDEEIPEKLMDIIRK